MGVTEQRFSAIIDYICILLSCKDVCIVWQCFDTTLCHPLLLRLHSAAFPNSYGPVSLLAQTHVWAVCDMAFQTGCVWTLETDPGERLVVAPLAHPMGMLGLLVCTIQPDERAYAVLQQRLAYIAECVEQVLQRMYGESLHPLAQALPSPSPRCQMTEAGNLAVGACGRVFTEQDALLSMVSHDLRMPLSVIKGYVGLLQVYGFPEDEARTEMMTTVRRQQYFAAVMEQIQHVEVLIGDLLDIAHLQSGQLKLRPECLDLVTLCQRVTQQMQDRCLQQESADYVIHCSCAVQVPLAWADEDRVRQVLVNLLENAVKYSPEGGLIDVLVFSSEQATVVVEADEAATLLAGETCLAITVRDYGIGIPQQQQSILFQPFQRAQQPLIKEVAGMGLGLYSARKLVEAMQGQIFLHSREGQGTSITFTLPIATAVLPSLSSYPTPMLIF